MSSFISSRASVVLIAILACISTSAWGQTILYVDDDAMPGGDGTGWSTAYKYLQDALGNAGPGDEVWVAQGTYRPDEDDANPNGTGNRSATFQLVTGVAVYGGFDGTESLLKERAGLFDQTVLSGDLLGNDGPDFANNDENSYHVVTANGVDGTAQLDGFTITGGNADGSTSENQWGGGLVIQSASPDVRHCTCVGNEALHGGGMVNAENSAPTVTACTFTDNKAASNGGGMYNYNSSNPTVADCSFSNSTANFGGGMYNYSYCSPAVRTCTFTNNTATSVGGGMYNFSYSSPTVTACTFSDNTAGIAGGGVRNSSSSSGTIEDCIFEGNTASTGGAVQCVSNSHPLIAGCQFLGNMVTGGTSSFTGLGGAISCEGGSNPEVTYCTFKGNTATGGSVGDTGFGGGVSCRGSTNVAFRTCLFRDNRAVETGLPGYSGWGGAIYLYGSQASVDSCTFVSNSAEQGGGAVSNVVNSSLVLNDCLFVDNVAHWSGALWNGDSLCEITRCRFIGNRAVHNSVVIGYPGFTGALNAYQLGCIVELVDSLVAGNTARYAGGIDATGRAVVRITNSSVVHNGADYTGGGIFNENRIAPAEVQVANSIVWGNVPNQIVTQTGSTTTVSYSCIQGGHPGSGNITDDPRFRDGPSGSWTGNATYDPVTGQTTFTDATAEWTGSELVGKLLNPWTSQYRQSLIAANTKTTIVVWGDFASLGGNGVPYQVHDYHLSLSSPAIDAGDNTAVPADTLDLDGDGDTAEPLPWDLGGNPRFIDHLLTPDTGNGLPPIVDMGADEFLPGEFHANDKADLRDFWGFQWCFDPIGPGTGDCEYLDFELDGDVDLDDFVLLEQMMNL